MSTNEHGLHGTFPASHHDHIFTSDGFIFQAGSNFSQCASHGTFVYLGQFFGYRGGPVGAEVFDQLIKGFQQAVRRFIKYDGVWQSGQPFLLSLTAFFMGKETFKDKAVVGQTRNNKGRQKSSRSWQAFHVNTPGYAFPDKQESWIGDCRGPGITHQGDYLPCFKAFEDPGQRPVFIELVMGTDPCVNLVLRST